MCAHIFFVNMFLIGDLSFSRSHVLSHMGTLCLTFRETDSVFSKGLHYFTFPPQMYEGSNYSTSLPTLVVMCSFDCTHLSGGAVV